MKRTVECGACESRFRIDDEVIVRGRKFFPGERNDSELGQFQRVPMPTEERRKTARPMIYGAAPDPAVIEPTSPQRIIAGIIGVAAVVVVALFLMLGGGAGMLLDGMSVTNRLVIAGFTSFMAMLALLYANPKARLKALAVGTVFAGSLLSLPFFFQVGSKPPGSEISASSQVGSPKIDRTTEEEANDAALDLQSRIGMGPLVSEIEKMTTEGSGKSAVGLWLRGLSYNQRFLVRDYMIRIVGATPSPSSHLYPRDGGDYLLLLSGVTKSIQELAEAASVLGNIENTYSDISVIEVRIDSRVFLEAPLEQLTDKSNSLFYSLNKKELESIDIERVKRAVQRLISAEPTILRIDITRKLIWLLNQEDVDFKKDICAALSVWSEHPGPASDAALSEVKKLMEKRQVVPPEMVALIAKEKNVHGIPAVDELWHESHAAWESMYGDFGSLAEVTMLQRFPKTSGIQRHSAVRILGRVGGKDSLPVITAAEAGANTELRIIIDQAKKAITGRLGL
jgi:hypothetical protein